VLLVEDDPDRLRLLEIIVEQAGHEPICCVTVADAKAAVDFELALVDRQLPDGDGLEPARSLGGRVILLTGDDTGFDASGLEVILTPVRAQQLLDLL
jgi:DNA-binding response OmpR family regulator